MAAYLGPGFYAHGHIASSPIPVQDFANRGIAMFEELERFEAISDTGDRYTIVHRRRIVTKRFMDGTTRKAHGSDDWITSCGIDLQPLSDGTFEMIQIDGILRRVG